MPLSLENIRVGEIVESDKGKNKKLDFIIIAIKGKSIILRFKNPLPEDKDIKVSFEKLAKDYTSRSDYLSNLLSKRY